MDDTHTATTYILLDDFIADCYLMVAVVVVAAVATEAVDGVVERRRLVASAAA